MSTRAGQFERFFTRFHARGPRPFGAGRRHSPMITPVVAVGSEPAIAVEPAAVAAKRRPIEPDGYDLTAF
jgi:hypothetical protein